MKKIPAFYLSASVLVSAFGCGADVTPDQIDSDNQAIIGGAAAPNANGVVALLTGTPTTGYQFFCSAAVVAPTKLLTAAHCLVGQTATNIIAYDGANFQNAKLNPHLVRYATTAVYDPAFDNNNPAAGHDVGVITVSAPFKTVLKLDLTTAVPAVDVGKPITIYGYGASKHDGVSGYGLRRAAVTVLDGIDAVHLGVGSFNKAGTVVKTACHGDSGGPAIRNIGAGNQIVGVLSYGLDTVNGSDDCVGESFYTRPEVYAPFIASHL